MLSWPLAAHAVQPDEILKDPVLEARARDLSAGLRCLVCQNQSIDDSNAELARDIRVLVRERLVAGDSDSQIRDFLVQRYGAFILLKPPFETGTLLLWGTPFLVLILGGAAILVAARRGKRERDPAVPLSAEEKKRLDEVLAGK
jgi:cytochrome c-type biogenesis protein CcmH